jgi:glycosyltransferase involved in cell wall biosynthesis
MRIHLVGLPHTRLDENEFMTCAFTSKAARWTRVLAVAGHEVIAYWTEGKNTVDCEVVPLISEEERIGWFGEDVGFRLPDVEYDPDNAYWSKFNARAIEEISARIEPGDIVAITGGSIHQRVVDAFKDDYTCIESGAGYEGLAEGTFVAFESYAWMHHRYGVYDVHDGRAFDVVVPNFYYPEAFHTAPDEGYALFVGRVCVRKGPHVAADIAERMGLPLKVAGAGVESLEPWGILATDGTQVSPAEYVGVVNPAERADLMAGATVLIVPTLYIEPFGSVHCESLMSGVPVLCSDWGAFPDTVVNGVDGFTFRMPAQAASYLPQLRDLRGEALRERSISRFSIEAVAPAFDEWLWRLSTLRNGQDGWNAPIYMG